MNCPNCGSQLRPGAAFCPRCGNKISSGSSGGQPNYPAQPQQQLQPQQQAPNAYPSPSGSAHPPTIQSQSSWSSSQGSSSPQIQSLGSVQQASDLWGPFAGYGTRRTHEAWLLEGISDRAESLRDATMRRFNQRHIPDANVSPVNLTGKGVDVEQRPFYRIQRGLATVWLYIARFGDDLYVSQVSYIKGPISKARVLLFLGLIGLSILSVLNLMAVSANISAVANSVSLFGGTSQEPNMFLISAMCCTGPLGAISQVVLTIALAFSVYKFITEKDFLALLRAEPNEFQEDDIVSLEKAVNETVRQAADRIGIDKKLLSQDLAYITSSNRQRLI